MNHEIDFVTFGNLMGKNPNVVYDLSCLVSNIKKKLLGFWILFPFKRNMKIKNHIISFF